jgi:hypothetical protein
MTLAGVALIVTPSFLFLSTTIEPIQNPLTVIVATVTAAVLTVNLTQR